MVLKVLMAKKGGKKQDYEYPEVEVPDYSDDELAYRGFLIMRLEKSRDARDQEHAEFDEMNYVDYWETNAKAGNTYIEPKRNIEDVRIKAGTTKEKVDTFTSALLGYNLEPNVMAYDRDNREVRELGENMEAMVKKSRKIETPDYDAKKILFYQEAAVQGDCFVEDVLVEYSEVGKRLTADDWDEAIQLKKVWSEEEDARIYREIKSNLISGLNFYPGNIRDFYMHSQPYIFTRELKTYEECEQLFSEWKRWENVPAKVNTLTAHIGEGDVEFHDWTLEENKPGFVEVIKYYDKPKNEFNIMLNGVVMLPVGFPLEALTGANEYPIARFSLFPITRHFFYSKGISAKTKVDQAMMDEMYRMYIVKTQKSVKPPLANNSGRHLTDRVFMPGRITNDLDPNQLGEIGTNQGVTQAEFNMLSYVKSTIDEKSVSSVMQGQSPEGQQTATETVMLQKQSMQKLGLAIHGAINFEKALAWIRLHNIQHHWTKAEDVKANKYRGELQNLYKRIEMEDTFDDGSAGTRIIEFTEEPQTGKQLLAKQKLMNKKGRKVKFIQLNPKELRSVKLNWVIEIEPTPKDSDALEKAQFEESMVRGLQVFGPQSFNMEYLKEQWALKNDLDPDKLFVSKEQQQMMQQRAQQQQQQLQAQGAQGTQGAVRPTGQQQPQAGRVNQQLQQAVRGRQPTAASQQKPSLNTLTRA